MKLLNTHLPSLIEQLALDEALLLDAEAGESGEILHLWGWPRYAVVLGAGSSLSGDIDEAACVRDHVEIARRASGGGTVLLGPGCVVYSLILSYERSPMLRELTSSYAYILEQIQLSLRDLLPTIAQAGTSDLISCGFKFSGCAQQRKRNYLLHHGTLLYDFNLDLIERYLKMPHRQPDYRAQRPRRDFLCNLPTTRDVIHQRLIQQWEAHSVPMTHPKEKISKLCAEKYALESWLRRKDSPSVS